MKKLLFLFFILLGTSAYSQQKKAADNSNESKDKIKLGSFDNYAFIMDGKLIDRNNLAEYPEAELYDIYPEYKILEGKAYSGAVYFHTNTSRLPISPFADDPAWFLNDRQVSSLNIRETFPECYTRIVKSTADTIIKGKLYKGSIHVTTEEDYFSKCKNLTKILEKYKEIDLNQADIFWFKSGPITKSISDVGMFIQDNFSINYLKKYNERFIKVDTLQFAKGRRFVIKIITGGTFNKAAMVFKNPLLVDTECPCYLQDFGREPIAIYQSVEIMPIPFGGKENYLIKLAEALKLPAKKSSRPLISDSINVNFLVTNVGMLAGLESNSDNTSANKSILSAIKKNSCVWAAGLQSGRFVSTARKMKIFYTKDQKGNIQSLDRLEFESI